MIRRWFALATLIVAAVLLSGITWSQMTQRPVSRPFTTSSSLVVVGMPALTMSDSPGARNTMLWQLAREGAVGGLLTRTVSGHSCANQAWLTLSAGARTSIGPTVGQTPEGQLPKACPAALTPVVSGNGAYFPNWSKWRHTTLGRSQPADIGRLASTLGAHGQCIAAAGPSAALGAADRSGRIADWTPDPYSVNLSVCPVTFIGLSTPDDSYLRWLSTQLSPDTTLVVAGLSDGAGPERLHAVTITGPTVSHGLLASESVSQPGAIATVDLSALVLSRVGTAAPTLPEGRQPLIQTSSSPTAPALHVVDLTRALAIEHDYVGTFLATWYATAIPALIVLSAAIWWRGRTESRSARIVVRLTAFIAAGSAAMPMSTMLVNAFPWWRTRHVHLALGGGIALISAVAAAIALYGPWRRWRAAPLAVLSLGTMYVIGMDVIQGSRLQFVSILGLQPIYGGRTSGMGNVAFGLLATAALLLAAIVAGPYSHDGLHWRRHRGLAILTVATIAAATIAVDGYPGWGADGGGSVALVPAFGYLLVTAAGVRLTWLRGLLIAAVMTLVGIAVPVLDYLRPPSQRTHLGDFVAHIRDQHNLGPVDRIWQANWTMLTSSPEAMCVPVLILLVIVILTRPESPLARPVIGVIRDTALLYQGLVAILIVWFVGFLTNDSGTAIPPAGMMLAAPLIILLAATEGQPTRGRQAQARRPGSRNC